MSEDDIPDPARLIKLARQTLSSAERRQKFQRIDFLDTSFWYRTQLEFFAAGASGVHQRLIYGGNQSGKTTCCAAETAWHLTGAYPLLDRQAFHQADKSLGYRRIRHRRPRQLATPAVWRAGIRHRHDPARGNGQEAHYGGGRNAGR